MFVTPCHTYVDHQHKIWCSLHFFSFNQEGGIRCSLSVKYVFTFLWVRLKNIEITIFILVTRLIPLWCLLLPISEWTWLLCSISILRNESNVSIWRGAVRPAGVWRGNTVYVWAAAAGRLRLGFQECHQRDAARLIHPGRVLWRPIQPLPLLTRVWRHLLR